MSNPPIILHLVSEATGQALEAVMRACGAQFQDAEFAPRNWNLVRTRVQVARVLTGIRDEPGPVLSSLTSPDLQTMLRVGCARIGVQVKNILDGTIHFLEQQTGIVAERHPGGQYVMDESYRRRIDAMQYVIAHDDGQKATDLAKADVILVGVSRTSKTPTCFYLANRGIRAANIPLVPHAPLPPALADFPGLVVGLTIDPYTLLEIRRSRVGMMLPGRSMAMPGMSETSLRPYIDPQNVQEELNWARRLCARHKWPVINVTHRSVEETAAAIIDMLEHDGVAGRPPVADRAGPTRS